MIQISWQAVSVLIVIFSALCGLGLFILRLLFRAELAEFRMSMMRELNGKYMNAEIARERLEQIAEELKTTRHNLRNEIHILLNLASGGGKRDLEIGSPR